MKLVRRAMIAGVLASAITGCTYTDSEPRQEHKPAETSAASTSAPTGSAVMEGQFQSLAGTTTGTATLEVNESGAVLQLADMATEPGKDLRVMLSPGTLASGAGGEPELSSTRMIEIGPFRAGTTHRFVMDRHKWESIQEPVGSVLIYDYSAKNTRGAAVLGNQK